MDREGHLKRGRGLRELEKEKYRVERFDFGQIPT